MFDVGITGTGAYVPEKVLTNADLEKMVDTSDEWIVSRTGIRERRIAADMPVSELCIRAAEQAMTEAEVVPGDLDLIVVTTITPDYPFPATACIVADRLGARNAAAFDLEAGCTGFVYGLVTASQFIASGLYRTVLVIGGDALSKVLDWEDRSTCILFGDGAGAAVLQRVPAGYGLLASELGADGAGAELLLQKAGGSKYPVTAETVGRKEHVLRMAGGEVFKFAVRVMESVSFKVLAKAGLEQQSVDWFIPHQANIRIIDAAMKRLGIGPEKVVCNLDRFGNMSAASIPVALDEIVRAGKVRDGDIILLVGFGAGLTWGASVLKWYGKRKTEEENG